MLLTHYSKSHHLNLCRIADLYFHTVSPQTLPNQNLASLMCVNNCNMCKHSHVKATRYNKMNMGRHQSNLFLLIEGTEMNMIPYLNPPFGCFIRRINPYNLSLRIIFSKCKTNQFQIQENRTLPNKRYKKLLELALKRINWPPINWCQSFITTQSNKSIDWSISCGKMRHLRKISKIS